MTTLPTTAQRYLDALDAALDGVPDAAKQAILDDVRAHVSDAAEEGRDIDATLAALGAPEEVARDAREQLGVPAASDPTDRAARFLRWSAVVLALITAAIVIFLLPSHAIEQASEGVSGTGSTLQTSSSLFAQYGLGIALLPLIPAAFALLPIVLTTSLRTIAGWAVAALMTVFAVIAGFSIGGFYLPLALLLWAAMLVPGWIRRGRNPVTGRIWRIVGAVILSAPVIFTFGGLATGSLQDATLPFWLVSIGFLVLGVLFALRLPHVDTIVAVIGAGLMLLGAIDAGLLVLAFWMAGGLWLVTGLSGAVARGGIRPLR